VDSAEHRKLALQAARKLIVLLKNEKLQGAHPLLPIARKGRRGVKIKVAMIEPHANSTQALLSN